jgi:hypothetical protein
VHSALTVTGISVYEFEIPVLLSVTNTLATVSGPAALADTLEPNVDAVWLVIGLAPAAPGKAIAPRPAANDTETK